MQQGKMRRIVLDHKGEVLERTALLAKNETGRWTIGRKADVVIGVRAGLVSLEEIAKEHNISADEVTRWAEIYAQQGLEGLKVKNTRAA